MKINLIFTLIRLIPSLFTQNFHNENRLDKFGKQAYTLSSLRDAEVLIRLQTGMSTRARIFSGDFDILLYCINTLNIQCFLQRINIFFHLDEDRVLENVAGRHTIFLYILPW